MWAKSSAWWLMCSTVLMFGWMPATLTRLTGMVRLPGDNTIDSDLLRRSDPVA